MSRWQSLIDEAPLASVLPAEYTRYRRPIHAALTRFLDGLPEEHQAAILADQMNLPPGASIARRLATLAQSCPVLHKLGQVLARDRRLSPELREHLQALESLAPSVSTAEVREVLDREVGPIERLGLMLDQAPLAEASVAFVVPFHGASVPGVFKVLKPGIEERLDTELAQLEDVGALLDERCDDFQVPHLGYQEVFEQVGEKLRQEVRLDLEQRHLVAARAFYRDDRRVQIPDLLGPCGPRVTAMSRVFGAKITDRPEMPESEKRCLVDAVISALIVRPIFAKEGMALFHADPHAGNLFATDDGRLAILDWALAGSLGRWEREVIVQVVLGAMTLDRRRIALLLRTLAEWRPVDDQALDEVVRKHVRKVRRGEFPGFHWLLGLLDEAVRDARLRVPADLLLFRKSLLTLEGVLADLGADGGHVREALQGEFVRQLVRELPRRMVAPPTSRDFAIRVSFEDLVQLVGATPFTLMRSWLDEAEDLLGAVAGRSA
jgi:ubiquinone biosynthesis protein